MSAAPNSAPFASDADLIAVPRSVLAAACYCVRKFAPEGETYDMLSALSLAAKTIPFSTYPEDHETLLRLARECEQSEDNNAVKLGDLVRAILEDEAVRS